MKNLGKYKSILKQVRLDRGEFCEACGEKSKHIHHIIRVSETGIHSELIYDPANMIILCDDCHALMHPLIRNISEWEIAGRDRGLALNRQT